MNRPRELHIIEVVSKNCLSMHKINLGHIPLLFDNCRNLDANFIMDFTQLIPSRKAELGINDFGHNVLLVMPHPDDMEIHCGGTVQTLAKKGISVHLVICSSGVPELQRKKYRELANKLELTRQKEQIAAAALLGVSRVTFLSHSDDFELKPTKALVDKIAEQICCSNPDSIILFDHKYPSISSKKDKYRPNGIHPDHLATAEAGYRALLESGMKELRPFYVASKMTNSHFCLSEEALYLKVRAMMLHKSQKLYQKGIITQVLLFNLLSHFQNYREATEVFAVY